MKLLVIADSMSVHGINQWQYNGGHDVSRLSESLSLEVNAVIKGALDAGVKEVFLRDRTWNGNLLNHGDFPSEVQLIQGSVVPGCGIESIKHINTAFLIGIGTQRTVDTSPYFSFSPAHMRVEINGFECNDVELLTYTLAENNIRVSLVSGDSQFGLQYKDQHPPCQVVFTNNSLTSSCLRAVHPQEVEKRFFNAAKIAVKSEHPTHDKNIKDFLTGYYECSVTFRTAMEAEAASLVPWVSVEVEKNTVYFYVSSMTLAYRFIVLLRHMQYINQDYHNY